MIKRHLLLSMAAVAALTACGTAEKEPRTSPALAFKSDRKFDPPQAHYFYESFARANSAACPKPTDKFTGRNWKWLASRASACVLEKNWGMVEVLGHSLCETEFQSPWGPYFLSLSAENKNNTALAQWMIDLALRKDGNLSVAHYQKAKLFWQTGKFNPAVQSAKTAVKLDPNMAGAHLLLAENAYVTQDFPRAALHFEGVLKIEPRSLAAMQGLVASRIAQKESKEALQVINRALDLHPKDAGFYLQRAYVLENLDNDYETALAEYKRIAKMRLSPEQLGSLPLDEKIKTLETLVAQSHQKKATVSDRDPAAEGVKK